MALSMPRPWRDPETGIYYVRMRIPTDLVRTVGKEMFKRSLGTRDPNEARLRFPKELDKLQTQWDELRRGPRDLTEREAHTLAVPVFDAYLARHQDNPILQPWWAPAYPRLWTHEYGPAMQDRIASERQAELFDEAKNAGKLEQFLLT